MRKTHDAIDAEALVAQDSNVSYALIAEMIGTGKTVLDAGCGPGNLAAVLLRRGSEVMGIDADPAALRAADRYCVATALIDLNATPFTEVVGERRFDVVVFADVLQHLAEPGHVLAAARAVLAPGGFVVASIPNVAHGAVRLALLRGRFEYQRLGILDQDHMRFFTLDSIERLFEDSGYVIGGTLRTTAPVFEQSDLVPLVRREDFDAAVVDEVLAYSEADTLQFVVRGYPLDDDHLVLRLRADVMTLEQNVRTLQAQLAQAAGASGAGSAAAHADVESEVHNAVQLADDLRRQLANKEAMGRAERGRLSEEIRRATADAEQLRATVAAAQAERERLAAAIAQRDGEYARVSAELARREAERTQLAQTSRDLAARDAEMAAVHADLTAVAVERDRLNAQFARLISAYEEASSRLSFAEIERERFAERLERVYALLELREASARDQDAAADRMLSALARRRHEEFLTEAMVLGARVAAQARRSHPLNGSPARARADAFEDTSTVQPATEIVLFDETPPPEEAAASGPAPVPAADAARPLRSRIGAALRKVFSP
jgi:2-polyprenyl-3-methyl-5-hydroxy-6-metoxy-1,4-benzoquinol methylase